VMARELCSLGFDPGMDRRFFCSPEHPDRCFWPAHPFIQCVSGVLSLGARMAGT
jgi:hypothetical protein